MKDRECSTNLPDSLRKNQRERTEGVKARIKAACQEIERELKKSGGIYPQNGGRLSLAEVCRRAEINQMTLYGPKHKKTTKPLVDQWLVSVLGNSPKGNKEVRKAVTERADQWKSHLDAIAQAYQISELELVATRAELRSTRSERDDLLQEVQMLRAQISFGQIVPIRTTKKTVAPR